MNFRDQEYIENRLMDSSRQLEAAGRLRQCGMNDLAEQVTEATQEYFDKVREIRTEMTRRIVRSR